MRAAVSLAFALCAFGSSPPDFQLPGDLAPLSHTARLDIDPNRSSFSGVMRIEVELKAARKVIWLNGRDLSIQRATITFKGKSIPAKSKPHLNEFVGLELRSTIGPGKATIEIEYSAPLSSTAKSGPYRRQTDGDWYAFTVFTPIEARRAFPCFDEPRFKTPWQLTIRTKTGDKAFTNSPSISEDRLPGGGGTIFHFAPTQVIAAEVVAFAVGPFDIYDGGKAGERGTAIRVLTPKGHAADGAPAADATRHVLARLEQFTGIPYPWDKLDHVALPEGAFGAVENPGLITYLSTSLLLPASASLDQIRNLRGLEAHELAHQWFGNLVTQASWEDVWLSEGFATWFSSEVMDQDESPERAHLRLEAHRSLIMEADDSSSTHPVRRPKENRTQLESVYDRFPYDKGAGILLTLEGWLGTDVMRTGLRRYLKDHANGNATSSDLAAALSSASGKDVKAVLDSLLDHSGVPVIQPAIDCSNQKAVILQPGNAQNFPVCWRTDSGSHGCDVVHGKRTEIALKMCPAWVVWNTGGTGYYRTQWTKIPPVGELTAAERLTLARDLKSFPLAGADDLLNQLKSDKEPEVAAAAN